MSAAWRCAIKNRVDEPRRSYDYDCFAFASIALVPGVGVGTKHGFSTTDPIRLRCHFVRLPAPPRYSFGYNWPAQTALKRLHVKFGTCFQLLEILGPGVGLQEGRLLAPIMSASHSHDGHCYDVHKQLKFL